MSEIMERLLAIQSELTSIGKEQKNAQQGWKFRGVDDVMNTLHPLLVKHKVLVVPQLLDINRSVTTTSKGAPINYASVTVKYDFYASDKSCISCTVAGEGMDSGDKSTSKALSIAYKYAMFQVFCIPTEDDPDKDVYEAGVPTQSASECKAAITEWLKTKQLSREQYEYLVRLKDTLNIQAFNSIKDKIDALPNRQTQEGIV